VNKGNTTYSPRTSAKWSALGPLSVPLLKEELVVGAGPGFLLAAEAAGPGPFVASPA